MKIKDLPWFDRPGERLSQKGVEALSSSDLLAVLLGKGKFESVMDLSGRLLSKYDFDNLEGLSLDELTKECKGDKVSALKVLSFIELSKRYHKKLVGGYDKKVITSAKDVYNMFSDEMRNLKQEVLKIILLDTKNNVIGVKEVSKGTLNASLVHPREVFKEAIKSSAFSIILVHNHPSGDCSPSEEDISITKKLAELGEELGVKVLDHVIVGRGKYWNWLEVQS